MILFFLVFQDRDQSQYGKNCKPDIIGDGLRIHHQQAADKQKYADKRIDFAEQPALNPGADGIHARQGRKDDPDGAQRKVIRRHQKLRLQHKHKRYNEGHAAEEAGAPPNLCRIPFRDTGGRVAGHSDGRCDGRHGGEVYNKHVSGHGRHAQLIERGNCQRSRQRISRRHRHSHAKQDTKDCGDSQGNQDVLPAETEHQAGEFAA